MEVKLLEGEEPGERFVLCRSADRRSKERAMHEKFSQRIETALKRLQRRIARSKKPLDRAPIHQQIGDNLFRRVIPNLKRIGLLSDRIRPHYAALGLLAFEHERSAPELTAEDLLRE